MRERKYKTGLYLRLLLLFVMLFVATDLQPVQAAVKLNQTSASMCVGDSMQLKLTGTSKKVTWKSSAPKIVRVTSKGKIKALKKGNATITATCNKKNYKCKVAVNRTFKLDRTNLSIKKNTDVTAYLSVSGGTVDASIADKKICSVTFGKWDGDYLSLTIVPKKVGSTTITFVGGVKDDKTKTFVSSETCTLKVTVKALPSNATFQTPAVSSGADAFIVGENTMSFAFQLDRKANSTLFRVYDTDGSIVREIPFGKVAAKRRISFAWDGRDDSGMPLNGTFRYGVVADGNRTIGGNVSVLSASPFGIGDGSENNPFRVSNLAELYLIRDYNGAYFVQDADIDFNYSVIAALFDDSKPFTGTYDGKYENITHQMSNLFGYNSVFGVIGTEGTVKNVSMNNCVLNTTGSLLATTNNGTIDTCSVNGNILCNAGNQAAMLVMYNKGQIRNCNVSGKLTVNTAGVVASTALKAGGVALNNAGTIVECNSSVEIVQQMQIGTYIPTCAYEIYSGGIVAENAANGFVTQCTFTGTVSAQVTLPDALKDTPGIEAGKIYSGYAAGSNMGYISRCINAGAGKDLTVQGTGTGMVQ